MLAAAPSLRASLSEMTVPNMSPCLLCSSLVGLKTARHMPGSASSQCFPPLPPSFRLAGDVGCLHSTYDEDNMQEEKEEGCVPFILVVSVPLTAPSAAALFSSSSPDAGQ